MPARVSRVPLHRAFPCHIRIRGSTLPCPPGGSTLLLPLIGHLDARRAADVNRTLLEAISRDRTHTAVLDITGLAQADAEAAAALQALVQSAKLLGCEVVLVGVRPEHALILARSDLSHDSMRVARDIPMVLQTLRGTVV